jgi:hypothetical protein
VNLFQYVHGDPVNLVDPLGLAGGSEESSPSGKWQIDQGMSFGGGILWWGGSKTEVTLRSLSSPRVCSGVINCKLRGPILDLTWNFTTVDFETFLTPNIVEGCYTDEALMNYSWSEGYISVGPIDASSGSLGLGVSPPLGFGMGKKHCRLVDMVCGDRR